MGFLTDLTLSKSKTKEEISPVKAVSNDAADVEKGPKSATSPGEGTDDATFTARAQAGVKRVEAATTVWTKWHLVGAYLM